jgi:hypothetical protein
MKLLLIVAILACPMVAAAEIHHNGGKADALSHEKYGEDGGLRARPVMEGALDALEKSVAFVEASRPGEW